MGKGRGKHYEQAERLLIMNWVWLYCENFYMLIFMIIKDRVVPHYMFHREF